MCKAGGSQGRARGRGDINAGDRRVKEAESWFLQMSQPLGPESMSPYVVRRTWEM